MAVKVMTVFQQVDHAEDMEGPSIVGVPWR